MDLTIAYPVPYSKNPSIDCRWGHSSTFFFKIWWF